MASSYIKGEVDLENPNDFMRFWEYIGPHVRKLDIDEPTMAAYMYGAARSFGYNRRQISQHHLTSDVLATYRQHAFVESYYSHHFHPPSSSLYQRAEDFKCPTDWDAPIAEGRLPEYLQSKDYKMANPPRTKDDEIKSYMSEFAKSIGCVPTPVVEEEESPINWKKRAELYQVICAAQAIAVLVLLIATHLSK